MPKRTGELRQENPQDQLRALIGAVRGHLLTMDELDNEGKARVKHHLFQLCRAMEKTVEHLDDTRWNPEKSRTYRLK
jgi:hypothetical protein